eukprot:2169159-Rhodomonas_salina.1
MHSRPFGCTRGPSDALAALYLRLFAATQIRHFRRRKTCSRKLPGKKGAPKVRECCDLHKMSSKLCSSMPQPVTSTASLRTAGRSSASRNSW